MSLRLSVPLSVEQSVVSPEQLITLARMCCGVGPVMLDAHACPTISVTEFKTSTNGVEPGHLDQNVTMLHPDALARRLLIAALADSSIGWNLLNVILTIGSHPKKDEARVDVLKEALRGALSNDLTMDRLLATSRSRADNTNPVRPLPTTTNGRRAAPHTRVPINVGLHLR